MVKTPHWPKILGYKPIDLGLDRMHQVLESLGNPEKKLPPVVHVAGTNGKGSTIAFMRSILEEAGYKVHVYTSPHLVEFNERIVLAGKQIEDDFLNEVLETTREATGDVHVTFFEGTTLAAFLAFSLVDADIVLLETGLGGRLDATNVVDNPALVVLTPISIDHTEYLGDTMAEIAGEKAAIIKTGSVCVSSAQSPVAKQVIIQEAGEKEAELVFATEHQELESDMFGDFQKQNIDLAVCAIKNLEGFAISDQDIKNGVNNAIWPGRMQKLISGVLTQHLPEESEIWVDGGHNLDAAKAINSAIKKLLIQNIYLIVGQLNNRSCEEFISAVCDGAEIKAGYGVEIPETDDSYSSVEITEALNKSLVKATAAHSVDEAVEEIIKNENEPFSILICGSLYLAGSVLAENE